MALTIRPALMENNAMRRFVFLLCLPLLLFPSCNSYKNENARLKEEIRMVREENDYLKAEIVGLKRELTELTARVTQEREAIQKKLDGEREEMQKKFDAEREALVKKAEADRKKAQPPKKEPAAKTPQKNGAAVKKDAASTPAAKKEGTRDAGCQEGRGRRRGSKGRGAEKRPRGEGPGRGQAAAGKARRPARGGVTIPSAPGTRNIRLTLAYDGTNYHGWQRQPNAVTVEETLHAALSRILDHEVKIYAGARTDAGVHAMGQVANFRTSSLIDRVGLVRGLNSLLPRDIRARDALDADETFHARYSAKSKTYVYCILNRADASPFLSRYVLHFPYDLDLAAMKAALGCVVGEHDFRLQEERRGVQEHRSGSDEGGRGQERPHGIRGHRGDGVLTLHGEEYRGHPARRGPVQDLARRVRRGPGLRHEGEGRRNRPAPRPVPPPDKVLNPFPTRPLVDKKEKRYQILH